MIPMAPPQNLPMKVYRKHGGTSGFKEGLLTIKSIVFTDPDCIAICLSSSEEMDGLLDLSHILILPGKMIARCPVRSVCTDLSMTEVSDLS